MSRAQRDWLVLAKPHSLAVGINEIRTIDAWSGGTAATAAEHLLAAMPVYAEKFPNHDFYLIASPKAPAARSYFYGKWSPTERTPPHA